MNTSYGFGQTPSSNTGSNSQTLVKDSPSTTPLVFPFDVITKPKPKFSVCVDWLQGVACTSPAKFDFVIGEIGNIFKDCFGVEDKPFFSGRKFTHSRRSPKGSIIAWNHVDNDIRRGDIDWWLCLPATMLRGCDVGLLRRFLKFLFDMDFNCTRIDLAIDDYTKSIEKDVFIQACDNDLHHGFHTYGEQWQKTRAKPKGWTFYMGSFGSDKLYRFYNKSVESNGEIDSYRLEGQFRDTNAKMIFNHIVQQPKSDRNFLQEIANITYSLIDFYSGNRDKKERLDWWENFRNLIKASDVEIGSGRSKTSIEKSMQWLEKSVIRTLATVEEYYDAIGQDFTEFLNTSLESGRRKIRDVHKTIVKSALIQLGVNDSVSYVDACNGYF